MDSDIEDIRFLTEAGRVYLVQLAERITSAEPYRNTHDLDPAVMRQHLAAVRRRMSLEQAR